MKSLFILLAITSISSSAPLVHEGEIEGARYLILSPEKPNGKLLLLAHGYRPDDAPLSAQFDTDGAMEATLSNEGWVIASTSYRRNGWIIDDAFADLKALQEQVAKLHGKASHTYILGNSMGGQIAVLAAEGKLAVDGAIGIGTALQDFPKEDYNPSLNYSPKVPLILLINQEANRPMSETYFEKAGKEFTALWKIERPGHCNTGDSEELAAIRGLDDWLDGKEVAREKDATLPIPNPPSTARISMTGDITHVSEAWGNMTTTFVSKDLENLGIRMEDKFVVRVGEAKQVVTLTHHYSGVEAGEGAAFISPNGFLVLMTRNENLAVKLGVANSDKVTLSKD